MGQAADGQAVALHEVDQRLVSLRVRQVVIAKTMQQVDDDGRLRRRILGDFDEALVELLILPGTAADQNSTKKLRA